MPLIYENLEALLSDLRDYLLMPSQQLLEKLQSEGVLPLEERELEMATELLSQCNSFFKVYESHHYSNPLADALTLTTLKNAQQKGWVILYDKYQSSYTLSALTPEEFLVLSADETLRTHLQGVTSSNYNRILFKQSELQKLKDAIGQSEQAEIKVIAEKFAKPSMHNDYQQITYALIDYIKANFLPKLFRAVLNFDSQEPLYRLFAGNWDPNAPVSRWLSDESDLIMHGAVILCRDKDITELTNLSANWWRPTQQAALSGVRDPNIDIYSWPSLFQTKQDNSEQFLHKECAVPESIVRVKGYKFVSLTSYRDLVNEGSKLGHCISKKSHYLESSRFGNTHFLSLVDANNNSLLTVTVRINTSSQKVMLGQREGYTHRSSTETEEAACGWLIESINNGIVNIDFEYLEKERIKRANSLPLDEKFTRFLGFNPGTPEGLKTMKSLKDLYRRHTPKDFIENLHNLSHLSKINLDFKLPGKMPTSKEVNLLTKEEHSLPVVCKAQRRLRWTHNLSNPDKPEEKVPGKNTQLSPM